MKQNNKKIKNIPYSLSLDKNLKLINKNRDLENLLQDINNINKNILRYNQIENLLKDDNENEKEPDIVNLQKYIDKNDLNQNNIKDSEKKQLFGDLKHLCNKVYSPKMTIETESNIDHNFCVNNIKPYNNSIKEAMNSIFKKSDVKIRNRYFPKYYNKNKNKCSIIDLNLNLSKKLFNDSNNVIDNHIKSRNNSQTDRVINDYNLKKYQYNYYLPKTIETDRRVNVSYGNYASNHVKYNHPQYYVLDTSNSPSRNRLPPIKGGGKLATIDLLRRNNSNFNMLLRNKQNKYIKYYMAMKMKEMYKFKVNNN